MNILPSFYANVLAIGGLANVPLPRPHTLRHRTPPAQPVPLILKKRNIHQEENKMVRFFCSRELNGKSGFAVNGDGLLLRPGAMSARSRFPKH